VNFQASHVRLDLFVSIVYSRLSTVLRTRLWSHITQVLPRKWIYREFWTQSGSTQCLVRSSVILNFKSDGTEKRAWRLAYSLTIDNFSTVSTLSLDLQKVEGYLISDCAVSKSCQKVFLPLLGRKWLGTGILAHHRQQEASAPRNESRETKTSDEIVTDEMMSGDNVDGVALEAWT
jgi:hypothetical protein